MRKAATQAFKNAYSPYSKIKVGCALLTKSGEIYHGCNVENASFGATICAERSAVVSAISAGEKEITAVLILTDSKKPWPPCGMCRQVLLEFTKPETPVVLMNLKGASETFTMTELCPASFSAKQMR